MNRLGTYQNVFDDIEPFKGSVPAGFIVDPFGQLTEAEFRTIWLDDPDWERDREVELAMPTAVADESWFEVVNWVEAAREARNSYVMMTLGACYGAQAVGSYLVLQKLNPMPALLVAVEGVSDNIDWVNRQFRNNGIDPQEHWIIEAALSTDNQPVLFPVGGAGLGNQSSSTLNSPEGRQRLAKSILDVGQADAALTNILTTNGTGVKVQLIPDVDHDTSAELRFVSAITLKNLLAPFKRVDYIEADLQFAEIATIPPAIEELTRKVRRIHLGTHSDEIHGSLEKLFREFGWEVVFSYLPHRSFETPYGNWTNDDGVLTVVNPALAY
ncbi:MAG: hypothetical protein ISR50_08120 [Alphaproteobacteria bacterium]|nr:hypothetical protein [Alphaproteobacteria bacterium]MBL6952585.1 hypothetical protein [Alphaproteobacteria bacterium]